MKPAAIDPPYEQPKRVFATGATRDAADHKIDPEGYLSVFALNRYFQYMQKHSVMTDGSRRESDNWQKGIPKDVYVKSLLRHVLNVWELKRRFGFSPAQKIQDSGGEWVDAEEALCGVIFNAFGLLHELVK